MSIQPREVVCLVGRNGAGKTTTIDSIMGLLSLRSGKITFQGRDITRLATHARARLGIGYAPEDTGVFPDLTVAENLMISAWLAGSPEKRGTQPSNADANERIFSLFPELRALLQRRGLYLSGGEKKMVAIDRGEIIYQGDPANVFDNEEVLKTIRG